MVGWWWASTLTLPTEKDVACMLQCTATLGGQVVSTNSRIGMNNKDF